MSAKWIQGSSVIGEELLMEEIGPGMWKEIGNVWMKYGFWRVGSDLSFEQKEAAKEYVENLRSKKP